MFIISKNVIYTYKYFVLRLKMLLNYIKKIFPFFFLFTFMFYIVILFFIITLIMFININYFYFILPELIEERNFILRRYFFNSNNKSESMTLFFYCKKINFDNLSMADLENLIIDDEKFNTFEKLKNLTSYVLNKNLNINDEIYIKNPLIEFDILYDFISLNFFSNSYTENWDFTNLKPLKLASLGYYSIHDYIIFFIILYINILIIPITIFVYYYTISKDLYKIIIYNKFFKNLFKKKI